MAFRKKLKVILEDCPDVLVIPESECPEKLKLDPSIPKPEDSFWFGDNSNKGLGVYTYNGFKIEKTAEHKQEFRYVVPLKVSNGQISFNLLAIWCQKPKKGDNYGENAWNAINHYSEILKQEKVIVAGDFNSSSIWDKPKREANHSNIVASLNKLGIQSTYHAYHNEEQGKEKQATLYLQRKQDKPYHIDYCFASKFFMDRLAKVEIGKFEKWIKQSDHCPVIVNFK